tara:strand:+ start:1688 stop:2731 length:1044 start_codon:yes stop_codon:yes gene_type:complete
MKYYKQLFRFIFGFLITILILEFFLQIGEINSLTNVKQDKVLGSLLKSNSKFLYFNEGFSLGQVNDYGYYGPSYSKIKGTNIERIALVGDSYVEGVQVFERNHFRNKLENLLNSESSTLKYEILNFGRSGFNLNDAYCYYVNFVKQFNPTVKLIFISPGDLVNRGAVASRPYALIQNEDIVIDYGFSKSENFKFKEFTSVFRGKSVILGYMLKTFELIRTDNYKSILFGKFSSIKKRTNLKTKKKKKEILSDISKKIILELKNDNCIFVVHSQTTTNDYDYLLEEFLNFTKENKVSVINLDSLFEKLKTKNINYNYWPITKKKGHFNERGHNEIAKYLYKNISIIKN